MKRYTLIFLLVGLLLFGCGIEEELEIRKLAEQTAWYERHGKGDEACRMYIMMGNELGKLGDGPQAARYYLKAQKILADGHNLPLQYHLNRQMARLLMNQGQLEDAEGYAGNAFYYAKAHKDVEGQIETCRILAQIVMRSNRTSDNPAYYLAIARDLAHEHHLTEEDHELTLALANICLMRGQYDKARSLTASVRREISMAEQLDTTTMGGTLTLDAEVLRRFSHSLPSDSVRYYGQRALENAELRVDNQRKQTWLVLALAVIVILTVLFGTYIQRHRRRQELMAMRLQKLEELQRQAEDEDRKPLRQQAEEQMRQTDVYKRLSTLSDGDHPTDSDWQQLARTLDEVYPGYTNRLSALTRLSTHEHRVCLLLKAGFEPAEIAQLVLRSKSAVSSVRSRLYEKCFGRKGTPADWDMVIKGL